MDEQQQIDIDSRDKKCIILFSGFNQRAIIAFIRTLEKNNLKYAIIAKSQKDDIFLTEYRSKVLSTRESVHLVLEDILSKIEEINLKIKADEYIIAPTTEALNRFLLNYRDIFERKRYIIPLVDKEIYKLISNKHSFGELCKKNQILIPSEIDLNSEIQFPIVAKPKKYYSTITCKTLSPIIINTVPELNSFKDKYYLEDFYFQEFIDGRSLYLLYYFSKEGEIYKFSQENFIQQPDGKSMVAAISSNFHKLSESDKYEKIFKAINFFGLVMVEVKQKNEINYMIEANPRFWGPSQLFVDAGVNLFEAFLYDIELLNFPPKIHEPVKNIRYFWLGGVVDTYRKDLLLTYHKHDENYYLDSLPLWVESDIYRRPDTIKVFKKGMI